MKKLLAYLLMVATCYGVGYQVKLSDLNNAEWVEVALGDYRILWSDIGGVTPPAGWTDPNTNNLVGIWYMETTNGAPIFVDSSGNGRDATNKPTASTGVTVSNLGARVESGIERVGVFDGVDDYLTMGDVLDQGLDDWTYMAWVKAPTDATGLGVIACKGILTGAEGFGIFKGATEKAGVQIRDSSTTVSASGFTSLNDNNWHHVAGVVDRDNSSGLLIYVDGVAENTNNPTAYSANSLQSTEAFAIGARDDTGSGFLYFFDGLIDDTRIYNKALTSAEIGVIYTNTLHPTNSIETRLNQ